MPRRLTQGLIAILFLVLSLQTIRDYFLIWANAPEVRVQYETALVSAIEYLNDSDYDKAGISTTTPDRFHSPAVAQLTLKDPELELRWFDGQHSILFPGGDDSALIFSGFAPLSPYLERYFSATLVEELPMEPEDLDRPLTVFSAGGPLQDEWPAQFVSEVQYPVGVETPVQFGQAAEFLGYDLQTPIVAPGDQVRLATLWRLQKPLEEAVIFTHVLGPDGQPVAQADRLDAPSTFWYSGDTLIQLHEMTLPGTTAPGEYPLRIGLYTAGDLRRLPVIVGGQNVADYLQLPMLTVTP